MPSKESSIPEPSKVELVTEPIAAGAVAILGSIPLVGAVATTALSAWQTANYKKFAQAVQNNFNRIDQTKLDKAFLKSDEFKALVIQSVEASIRSASNHKCKALANALLSSVIQPTCKLRNKTGIVRAISQLSDEEMIVLKALYDHENCLPDNPPSPTESLTIDDGPFMHINEIAEILSLDRKDISASLDGLEQLGLSYDLTSTFEGFDSRRKCWRITTLGTRSCDYALDMPEQQE